MSKGILSGVEFDTQDNERIHALLKQLDLLCVSTINGNLYVMRNFYSLLKTLHINMNDFCGDEDNTKFNNLFKTAKNILFSGYVSAKEISCIIDLLPKIYKELLHIRNLKKYDEPFERKK